MRAAAVVVVLAAALAACGRGHEETPEHALPPSDPGVPLEAEVGEEIRLVVTSNPTTGYRWEMSTPPDTAVVLYSTSGGYYATPAPEGTVGAGGNEIWSFQAKAPGRTQVGLRQLDPRDAPGDEVRYTLIVHPADRGGGG